MSIKKLSFSLLLLASCGKDSGSSATSSHPAVVTDDGYPFPADDPPTEELSVPAATTPASEEDIPWFRRIGEWWDDIFLQGEFMKTVLGSFMLLTLASCGSLREKVVKNGDVQPPLSEVFKEKIIPESVEQHIANWPAESREAVMAMLKEHGVPQGVTDGMVVWNDLLPYRQTIVYKEPLRHQTHRDVKEYLTTENSRICEHEATKTVSR